MTWRTSFLALRRLLRSRRLPPGTESALWTAMIVEDGVLHWTEVRLETIQRYTRQAMGLAPNNVAAYVATWRRWGRQDMRRRA